MHGAARLAASLARLEARIAFETLLSRCCDLDLGGSESPLIESMLLWGPSSLPLLFEQAAWHRQLSGDLA